MKLILDASSKIPKYQQIIQQIYQMIESGELKEGDKLPPERDLGRDNGIARGTIQMAYQELVRLGTAYALRGSGTYIAGKSIQSKKELIVKEVDAVFEKARQLGLPNVEMIELFRKSLVRHMVGDVVLMTAWVDCCPEALLLAQREFKNVKNNSIQQFLLENVLKDPRLLDAGFELIVTTTHHYETLIQEFPQLIDRIQVVSIVTSSESIVELARIRPEERVVFWSVSKRFLENVLWQLLSFDNVHVAETFISDKERDKIEDSLKKADVLIVPKEYRVLGEPAMVELVEQYKERGGRVLEFSYEFDQGSLLHLQTYIYEMITAKEKHVLQ